MSNHPIFKKEKKITVYMSRSEHEKFELGYPAKFYRDNCADWIKANSIMTAIDADEILLTRNGLTDWTGTAIKAGTAMYKYYKELVAFIATGAPLPEREHPLTSKEEANYDIYLRRQK